MTYLSTQEVANLMKVTETTVKRYADDGIITCIKTPGGHRKFLIKEVISFAEKNNYPLTGTVPPPMSEIQLEQLQFGVETRNYRKISEVLYQEALEGDSNGLTMLLSYLYKHHISFSSIADEILRPALVKIGEQWEMGKLEISQEHLASQAITEALIRLAPEIHNKPVNGLTAVCACVEGDFHEIGLRSLAYALESEGWNVHYIGANTPFDTLSSFMKAMKPDLVCVSFTIIKKRGELLAGLQSIGKLAKSYGAKFLTGGFFAGKFTAEEMNCHHVTSSVYDAIAFAKDAFELKPGPKKKTSVKA